MDTFGNWAEKRAEKYRLGAGRSVLRNRHMNHYRGSEPPKEVTDKVIDSVLKFFGLANEPAPALLGNAAIRSVAFLKAWWKSEHGLPYERELIAAVAVDLVNSICAPLDLALYTIDLEAA